MGEFQFGHSAPNRTPAIVVAIPPGIATKNALLEQVASLLDFPEYYGVNWDAFEECMRDLSWLPPGIVRLVHEDLPLDGDPKGQAIYAAILAGAIDKHRASGSAEDRDLEIVFPVGARDRVELLLRGSGRQ